MLSSRLGVLRADGKVSTHLKAGRPACKHQQLAEYNPTVLVNKRISKQQHSKLEVNKHKTHHKQQQQPKPERAAHVVVVEKRRTPVKALRERGRGVRSAYLAAIANPESVDQVGVPDGYDAPTFKFKQMLDITLDDLSAYGGFVSLAVRPSLRNCLVVSTGSPSSAYYEMVNINLDGYVSGLGATAAELNSNNPDMARQLLNGEVNRFIPSIAASSSDPFAVPGFAVTATNSGVTAPHVYLNSTQGYATGMPSVGFFTWDINAYGTTSDSINNIRIGFECFASDGTSIGSTGVIASNQHTPGTLNWTGQSATSDYTFPIGTYYIRPYILPDTSATPTPGTLCVVTLKSIRISASVQSSSYQGPDGGYCTISKAYDVPDLNEMELACTAYRPVAASCLSTYLGAVLENSEICARSHTEGGVPYNAGHDLMNFNFVSVAQPSYAGPLNTGAYTVWRPMNVEQATRWRHPASDPGWDNPWMSTIANWSTGTGMKLRIRVVLLFEATTNSQHLTKSVYAAQPDELMRCMRALAHLKLENCNPLHLKAIGDWLTKAAKGVWNNRAPIAGAIGAGIPGSEAWMPAIQSLISALPNA